MISMEMYGNGVLIGTMRHTMKWIQQIPQDQIKEDLQNKIQKLTEAPFDKYIWEKCWKENYFDFSQTVWELLSHSKQVEYAKKYQKWYSLRNELAITKIVIKNGVEFVFKLVPPGKFWMGSPEKEKGRKGDEKRHTVLISEPFYVGETEVTQEQWEAIKGNNPALFQGAQNPVENVSWEDCESFCEKSGFKMLTEKQWEYACRSGTTSEFNLGNDIHTDKVNYDGKKPYRGKNGIYRTKTIEVKSLPNENS